MPRRRRSPEIPLLEGAEVGAERTNRLLYGDNLTVMKNMTKHSVDLIYLDPARFNGQRTYNLIYTKLTGLPEPVNEFETPDVVSLLSNVL